MRKLAEKFGLTVLENIMECKLVRERASLIPYGLAKQKKLLPIDDADGLTVALSDPTDLEAIEELRLLLKGPMKFVFAEVSVIEPAIEHCYRQKEGEL